MSIAAKNSILGITIFRSCLDLKCEDNALRLPFPVVQLQQRIPAACRKKRHSENHGRSPCLQEKLLYLTFIQLSIAPQFPQHYTL